MESFASSRAAVPYTFAIWECSKCVEFTWTECTRKNAASEWWPIRKFYRRMKKQLKIFHRCGCGVAFTSLCLSITKRRNHASSTGESTFIANSDSGIHGINSTPKLPRRVKSTRWIDNNSKLNIRAIFTQIFYSRNKIYCLYVFYPLIVKHL